MMGGNTHEDSILGSDAKRSSDRTGNRGLRGSRLGRSATCDLLASGGLGPSGNRGGTTTPGRAAGLGSATAAAFPSGPGRPGLGAKPGSRDRGSDALRLSPTLPDQSQVIG